MPDPDPDYGHIRQSPRCPFCTRVKDEGLIVCWPCYRSHVMRNGLSNSDKRILDNAEQRLEARNNA